MSEDIDTKKYICKRSGCRKSFDTNSGRRKHFLRCAFPLPAESEITNKNYEETNDNKVKCLKCSLILSAMPNYYRHVRNKHTPKSLKVKVTKVYACNICSKEFSKPSKLLRHQAAHAIQTLVCENCNRVYKRQDWYERHVSQCNNDKDDNWDDLGNNDIADIIDRGNELFDQNNYFGNVSNGIEIADENNYIGDDDNGVEIFYENNYLGDADLNAIDNNNIGIIGEVINESNYSDDYCDDTHKKDDVNMHSCTIIDFGGQDPSVPDSTISVNVDLINSETMDVENVSLRKLEARRKQKEGLSISYK